MNIAGGHKVETVFTKPNHLRFDVGAIAADDIALSANHCTTANCFKGQPNHARQSPLYDQTTIITKTILIST
jgi:hypothetical protein